MKVQSLSVTIPTKKCVNSCEFCCSKLHDNPYEDKSVKELEEFSKNAIKRLNFSRANGCNVVILTGTGEALQNIKYLEHFNEWNKSLNNPFEFIEIQTTGIFLTPKNLKFLKKIGVSTISLSISDIFNEKRNFDYENMPMNSRFDLKKLCDNIKENDFNLRLSLNLLDVYNDKTPSEIFRRANELGADQITFREMYLNTLRVENYKQTLIINEWIKKHNIKKSKIKEIKKYIRKNGRELEVLPFGAVRYSVFNMSTVLDDDCMNSKVTNYIKNIFKKVDKENLKYLILRENGKLYTRWDDPGSLIF